ncbi:MAG: OstA-like protein [Candidatus Kapaibacterium sp.]
MKIIASIILLLSALSLSAQSSGGTTTGGEPIYVRHADLLSGSDTTGILIRELVGNVHIEQGNVTLRCNRATQYLAENRVVMIGNVKVIQGTVTLSGPSANYDGNTRIATGNEGVKIVDRKTTLTARAGRYSTISAIANFYGNVRAEDDSLAIDADTIEYHRSTENSFASGNVLMQAKYSKAFIVGDSAENYPSKYYSRVTGHPILFQIDTVAPPKDSLNSSNDSLKLSTNQPNISKPDSLLTRKDTAAKKPDTMTISSVVMESYRGKNERYIATGQVEVVRGGLSARADTVLYGNSDEKILLRGKPVVWYDSTQLSADSINVYVPLKKLKKIEAFANAFSASQDDSLHADRVNQLSGAAITIAVELDTLREVFARGEAKSLYFLMKETAPDGAARHSADSIRITMENSKPEIIRWLGGVNGENIPERMMEGKNKDYYLPAWRWEKTRPKKRVFVGRKK